MDQKDYKAIGKIIKEHYKGITSVYRLRTLSKRLADYFEREFKENLEHTEERFKEYKEKHDKFNREQFLKDCGVK